MQVFSKGHKVASLQRGKVHGPVMYNSREGAIKIEVLLREKKIVARMGEKMTCTLFLADRSCNRRWHRDVFHE